MSVTASAYGITPSVVVTNLTGDSTWGTVSWTAPPAPIAGVELFVSMAIASPAAAIQVVFSPTSQDQASLRTYLSPTATGFALINSLAVSSGAPYSFTYHSNI